jgi:riboflavin synthase
VAKEILMFTGIIQKVVKVVATLRTKEILHYALSFDNSLRKKLVPGASVSVDGVCQTVTKIENDFVWFDAIEETLDKTTLTTLTEGDEVNVERAAKVGDELGGHLISGHVCCRVCILDIQKNIYTFSCPSYWLKYITPKGFVALNGMSLTVCNVGINYFTVHLIPETLHRTTMRKKHVGDHINLEVDYLLSPHVLELSKTKCEQEENMKKTSKSKGRAEIADKLAIFTADTFVLYVKTLNFHWNMKGAQFFMFHKLLEEQYKNMAEAIDDLAERIRMLGAHAPASMKQFLKLATLEESHAKLSQEEMIKELVHDHESLEASCQKLIEYVDECLDQGSSDLLAERIRFHAKHGWLLRSHL